jgi:hypothetical protein
MTSQKLITGSVTVAMMAALTLGVSGCNALSAGFEEGAEQAIENATGGNVDIDAGDAVAIPADFPSDIPLIDAELFSSVGVGAEAERSWTLIFTVADPQLAFTDASGMLIAAGFSEDSLAQSAEGSVGFYSNEAWSVTLSAVPASGSEEPKVAYIVTPVS